MGLIDQITQMKSQGLADSQIAQQLQEQGNPPADIQNAFNQFQIKNAVSGQGDPSAENSQQMQIPQLPEQTGTSTEAQYSQDTYAPETYSQDQYYDPNQEAQQQYYDPQQYNQNYGYSSSDNSIEIAQQVVSEAMQKIEKKISDLQEFKTLADNQIKNIDQRLENIEKSFDRMQAAILEKVGSYGTNLESIKKEMSMMQDSFGKVVNSVVHKNASSKESQKKKSSKKSK